MALDHNKENDLKNLTYDVEALSNLCRFNITSRILMKKEKETLIQKLQQIYYKCPISEKLKLLLANIFSNLLKNKINHESIIANNSDLLQFTMDQLKNPKAKQIFETKIETRISGFDPLMTESGDYQCTVVISNPNANEDNAYVNMQENNNDLKKELNAAGAMLSLENMGYFSKEEIEKKILDKQIFPFIKIAKENFLQINPNILNKNNLSQIKYNFSSDPQIYRDLEKLIANISNKDQDNELNDHLNNLKNEINEICTQVGEAYKEHCNQINFNASLNEENIADSRQDNIIRRSIRLSVQNLVAKISASNKKVSILSKALIFTNNNAKAFSPLSCKDNEEMQYSLEKLLNHLLQLYNDMKTDTQQKRNNDRKILMGNLLNALKLLSVSPHNHMQILELGMLNLMEKINTDMEAKANDPKKSKRNY